MFMSVFTVDCPLEGSAEYTEAGGFPISESGAAFVPAKRPLL